MLSCVEHEKSLITSGPGICFKDTFSPMWPILEKNEFPDDLGLYLRSYGIQGHTDMKCFGK